MAKVTGKHPSLSSPSSANDVNSAKNNPARVAKGNRVTRLFSRLIERLPANPLRVAREVREAKRSIEECLPKLIQAVRLDPTSSPDASIPTLVAKLEDAFAVLLKNATDGTPDLKAFDDGVAGYLRLLAPYDLQTLDANLRKHPVGGHALERLTVAVQSEETAWMSVDALTALSSDELHRRMDMTQRQLAATPVGDRRATMKFQESMRRVDEALARQLVTAAMAKGDSFMLAAKSVDELKELSRALNFLVHLQRSTLLPQPKADYTALQKAVSAQITTLTRA